MSNFRDPEDILNSDDEFIDYSDETQDIPACDLEDRFEPFAFNWFKNAPIIYVGKQLVGEKHKSDENPPEEVFEEKRIYEGVLSRTDVMLLECYQRSDSVSDSDFIWLLNYLCDKNVRNKQAFFKGCLVHDSSPIIRRSKDYVKPVAERKYDYIINIVERY